MGGRRQWPFFLLLLAYSYVFSLKKQWVRIGERRVNFLSIRFMLPCEGQTSPPHCRWWDPVPTVCMSKQKQK